MSGQPYCAAALGNRTKVGCFFSGKERNGRPDTGPLPHWAIGPRLLLLDQTINASGKIPLAFLSFPHGHILFSRADITSKGKERNGSSVTLVRWRSLSFPRLVGCNPAKMPPLCKGGMAANAAGGIER